MSNRIIVLRTLTRAWIATLLIVALVSSLFILLKELSDPESTEPALVALLGGITGAAGTALGTIINAISHNPSDRTDGDN